LHFDGRTAAACLAIDDPIAQRANQRDGINRAVVIEAGVFSRDDSVLEIGRDARERYRHRVAGIRSEHGPQRRAGAVGKRHGSVRLRKRCNVDTAQVGRSQQRCRNRDSERERKDFHETVGIYDAQPFGCC